MGSADYSMDLLQGNLDLQPHDPVPFSVVSGTGTAATIVSAATPCQAVFLQCSGYNDSGTQQTAGIRILINSVIGPALGVGETITIPISDASHITTKALDNSTAGWVRGMIFTVQTP